MLNPAPVMSHFCNAHRSAMSSSRHMLTPIALALTLLVGPMWPGFDNSALAQTTPPAGQQPTSPQANTAYEAPLVDWSHAQEMYRLAEGWLREGDPGQPLEGRSVEVTGLTGVRVAIRWFGLRLGTGEASFETQPNRPGQAQDLTQMTRTAVRGAMLEVTEKLRDARHRGAMAAGPRADANARPPATIADLAGQLLLDIQIAGRLEPIRINPLSPAQALYREFAPGFHGLRMTSRTNDGTPIATWLWPADSIAAGLSPNGQILQLLGGLGIRLDQQNTVARPGGPGLERFQVIHMVRPGVNEPIIRLIRGNVLLPTTSVDGRTLDAMTLRLVDHLQSRQRESGQFSGTYLPSSDTYQKPQASNEDAALTCLALTRWTTSGIASSTSPKVVDVNANIRRWLDVAIRDLLTPEASPSPSTLALTLLVLTENPALVDRQIQRDMLANRLLRLRNEDGSFRANEDANAPTVDVPIGALVMDSLAAYYLQSRSRAVGAALPASMAWVWEQTDPLKSIGALPWLLEADARLETLTTADGVNNLNPRAQRAARLARLLPTLDIIMARQIVTPPAVGPADVVGGFELRELEPGTPPNPDWRSAHMMMVLSQSLRNTELTVGRNRVEGLLACGRAARFLGQLMFDVPGAYYARSVPDVVGGVRPLLWDNRLDLAPTAMTLIASCDLRKTLQQWAKTQQ